MVKNALSATLHPAIAPAFFDDMNLLRLNSGSETPYLLSKMELNIEKRN
jgi:hypothetical protein